MFFCWFLVMSSSGRHRHSQPKAEIALYAQSGHPFPRSHVLVVARVYHFLIVLLSPPLVFLSRHLTSASPDRQLQAVALSSPNNMSVCSQKQNLPTITIKLPHGLVHFVRWRPDHHLALAYVHPGGGWVPHSVLTGWRCTRSRRVADTTDTDTPIST